MPRPKQHRAGFTLVELLAVVAVIAVLIAILLPALRAARSQARQVRCLSQLREYGKGFQFYLSDYRDVFPPHRGPDGGPPHWYHLIDSYFRGGEMVESVNPGQNDESLYLARCPELLFAREDSGRSWQWRYDPHSLGYGYNDFWLGLFPNEWALGAYGEVRTVLWRRITEVRNTAECVLVADSQPKPDGAWSHSLWWPWIAAEAEGVATRHGQRGGFHRATYRGRSTDYPDGRGNIVWVDGSGSARRSPQINDLAEHRRFWDPGQGVGGW